MTENTNQVSICQQLCRFIEGNLVAPGIVVDGDTSLSKLGLDSFSIIEIVLFIERQFGFTLPDEALSKENIESPNTLAACVWGYLQENA